MRDWLAQKLPDFLWWDILGTTRTVGPRGIVTARICRVDNFRDTIAVSAVNRIAIFPPHKADSLLS
jgi:hypothetical protein